MAAAGASPMKIGASIFDVSQMPMPIRFRAIKHIIQKLIQSTTDDDVSDMLKEEGVLRESGNDAIACAILRDLNEQLIVPAHSSVPFEKTVLVEDEPRTICTHDWISALKKIYRTLSLSPEAMGTDEVVALKLAIDSGDSYETIGDRLGEFISTNISKQDDSSQRRLSPTEVELILFAKSLLYFFALGQKITRRQEYNKMSVDNVAIVIAPNLVNMFNLELGVEPYVAYQLQEQLKAVAKDLLAHFNFENNASASASASASAAAAGTVRGSRHRRTRRVDSVARMTEVGASVARVEHRLSRVVTTPPDLPQSRPRRPSLRRVGSLLRLGKGHPYPGAGAVETIAPSQHTTQALTTQYRRRRRRLEQVTHRALCDEAKNPDKFSLRSSLGAEDMRQLIAAARKLHVSEQGGAGAGLDSLSDSSSLSTSSDEDFDDKAVEESTAKSRSARKR